MALSAIPNLPAHCTNETCPILVKELALTFCAIESDKPCGFSSTVGSRQVAGKTGIKPGLSNKLLIALAMTQISPYHRNLQVAFSFATTGCTWHHGIINQ